MKIVRLFADLQAKPNKVTYQKIAEHYKNCNRVNEAEAFEQLIEKKYGRSTSANQEQRPNNRENS